MAAAVTGALAERRYDRRYVSSVGVNLLGDAPHPDHRDDLAGGRHRSAVSREALELGFIPFLLGDVVKVLVASAVLPLAWKAVGSDARRGPG